MSDHISLPYEAFDLNYDNKFKVFKLQSHSWVSAGSFRHLAGAKTQSLRLANQGHNVIIVESKLHYSPPQKPEVVCVKWPDIGDE